MHNLSPHYFHFLFLCIYNNRRINKACYNVSYTLPVIRMIQIKLHMRQAKHVADTHETRNAHKILDWKYS